MAISEQRKLRMDQKANQIMAILLPLLEVGGLAYATYVLIYLVCVQYLIQPSRDLHIEPRKATGIALLVVYCLLLLLWAVTLMRLLQVIWTNPGVVPLGDPACEKEGASTKYFDRLDAYICDYEGYPLWCPMCHNWKPDRTHHSSQLGRCVKRMDHFCPYAGGIISETSHKFFVQLLFYGFLYTGYVLIVMAVFLAERSRKLGSSPSTWIVLVGIAALFFLFSFGMFMTTFYNMAINYTTVETMQKGSTYNIALLKSKNPASSQPNPMQSNVIREVQRGDSRSYIVVQTQHGENPWDRGVWQNVRDVMGERVVDWFSWKMGPCTVHNDHSGEFAWGSVVKKMMDQHGAGSPHKRSSRPRSRRRQSSATTTPR